MPLRQSKPLFLEAIRKGRTAPYLLAFVLCACRGDRESVRSTARGAPAVYRIQGKVFKSDKDDHSGIVVFCAGTSYDAYSDDEGQYVISGVPAGTYKVLCRHPDFESATIDTVSIADGVADPAKPIILANVTLQEKMTPAQQAERVLCSIMGQVLLDGRTTAQGVVVHAVDTDFRTVTATDGSYQLLRLDPGQYTLMFEKEDFRSQRLSVRLESGDLVFQDPVILEPLPQPVAGRVINGSVTVVDSEGNAVEDYAGVLVYVEGAEGTARLTQPDADGLFRVDNLPATRYTIAAAGPAFLSRDRVEADLVDALEASVALTLQILEELTTAPGTLLGRVLKDDPEDTLAGSLVGLVEIGATAMTDASGNYSFTNVPAGTYTVVAQADGYFPSGLEEVVVTAEDVAQAIDVTLEKQRDYPRVLATTPANGERNVMVREVVPLTVQFSKKMQPESLRAAFSIRPPVAYVLYVGREHPQSDFDRIYVELIGYGEQPSLQFNRSYTVTIDSKAADLEGLGLEAPFRFGFRTGRASVIATNPPNGARDVFVNDVLYRPVIYFNARIDPRSVSADKILVRPRLNSAIQVSFVDSPDTGWSTIQLIGLWQPDVRYSVTLSGGVRTLNNSPISNTPYTFRFQTEAGRSLDIVPGRSRGQR